VSLSVLAAESLLDAYGAASSQIAVDLAQLFETARDRPGCRAPGDCRRTRGSRPGQSGGGATLLVAVSSYCNVNLNTDERFEREMSLLTTLGVALGAMQGMARRSREGAAHAYDLWKRLGARPNLFPVAYSTVDIPHTSRLTSTSVSASGTSCFRWRGERRPRLAVVANNCLGIHPTPSR
jgi:hypothetical protein